MNLTLPTTNNSKLLNTTQSLPSAIAQSICYLNGDFCPLGEAKISVLDRGFIFGDGIYEVVPIYYGRPFRFEQHMQRLQKSLDELRIPNPFTKLEWLELINELTRRFSENANQTITQSMQIVYIQISRGVAPRDHAMPTSCQPTVFIMTNPLKAVDASLREKGVSCISATDFRWEKAHIKSTSLLGSVMARQISADMAATETILFRGNFLSEASSSNVWVVHNGRVSAPPKNNLVLEGIRYGLLEEICKAINVPFELRPISREEVFAADEVLLSSATKEVLAVAEIDSIQVGAHTPHAGRPGPMYKALYDAYQFEIVRICKA
jgi:D-alanine transaminase